MWTQKQSHPPIPLTQSVPPTLLTTTQLALPIRQKLVLPILRQSGHPRRYRWQRP